MEGGVGEDVIKVQGVRKPLQTPSNEEDHCVKDILGRWGERVGDEATSELSEVTAVAVKEGLGRLVAHLNPLPSPT